MDKEFDISVSKSLAGEADEGEKVLLRETLHDNADNTLAFNQIKEYWNADVSLDSSLAADVARKALAAIGEESRRMNKQSYALHFWRAAAAILLLVTCGTAYYYNTHRARTYTYYATQENTADYTLQDGTRVKLNQNSAIAFADDYDRKTRTVELRGEAFFDVRKNPAKTFTVKTQGTETQVLGTKFNLSSDETGKQVIVTLVEGSVRFTADKCNSRLKPGEELVYDATTNEFSQQTTDIQYHTAWTEGRYYYENIAFGELLKKIEHIYGVTIEMNEPELEARTITASLLTDRPLTEILTAMQDEFHFKFKDNDGKIIITKK